MLALHALFGDAPRGTRVAAVACRWVPVRARSSDVWVVPRRRRTRHRTTALAVYRQLRQNGFVPDAFTVVSLLKVFRNDGLHRQAFMVSSLLLGTVPLSPSTGGLCWAPG